MFYINISNGLLEDDHQERMGAAVWQFMWLIDKVTKIDEEGTGWVLGGKPLQLKDLAGSVTEDTISRNLKRLAKEGYIMVKRTPYGLIISVIKAKKRFGNNVESRTDKNAELDSTKMPNHSAKMSDLIKTVQKDSNNKTVAVRSRKKVFTDQAELKKFFWDNPLFPKLIQQFPDRDYNFQFEKMCQWYLSKKGRLPQMITAFSNWLEGSHPDEAMHKERMRKLEKEEQDNRQKQIENTPRVSPERLAEIRQKMGNIGKKL